MKNKKYNQLINAAKREKRRNYAILYVLTLAVWVGLVIYSFINNLLTFNELIVDIIISLVGVLPPILLFDFFNEKLSKDASAIEMSNKITETLMSNPETLDLFTAEQKEQFILSTIQSIAKDEDVTEMINDSVHNFLFSSKDLRIRSQFFYDFELHENLPAAFDGYIHNKSDYFYVQEKLNYKVKYISDLANTTKANYIKIGFSFSNSYLDSALRENGANPFFENCIFREALDIKSCDIDNFKTAISDKTLFQQLFKLDLQIDHFSGCLENVEVSDYGVVCLFKVDHDVDAKEHQIRVIFHMPKIWGSALEVSLVDPVKAPKISLSYPEDSMTVEMYSFLSKNKESSIEIAHEHLNGIYDVALSNEWVYPISGIVFTINKK